MSWIVRGIALSLVLVFSFVPAVSAQGTTPLKTLIVTEPVHGTG